MANLLEWEGIKATEAVERIAERWQKTGDKPITDKVAHSDKWESLGKQKLGILRPRIKEALNNVNRSEWKKIRICLDSGAGETVIAEDDLPEIPTKESWGSKHGQSYEVANGEEIKNLGEKKFVAHMVTTEGMGTGGKGITAQICDVHRPLMSVKKICRAGYR